jgi:hypothetical protein
MDAKDRRELYAGSLPGRRTGLPRWRLPSPRAITNATARRASPSMVASRLEQQPRPLGCSGDRAALSGYGGGTPGSGRRSTGSVVVASRSAGSVGSVGSWGMGRSLIGGVVLVLPVGVIGSSSRSDPRFAGAGVRPCVVWWADRGRECPGNGCREAFASLRRGAFDGCSRRVSRVRGAARSVGTVSAPRAWGASGVSSGRDPDV